MKKISLGILCILIITSLFACKKNEKKEEKESTEIANPYQTCKNFDEAEELAGFPLTAPSGIQGYESPIIQAIKEEMIEVIYKKGDQAITVRKASSVEDVSGDHNPYQQERKAPIEGRNVNLKGNDDYIYLATWKDGIFSYAVTICGEGLTQEEAKTLIKVVE